MIPRLAHSGWAVCVLLMLVSCASTGSSAGSPANRNIIERAEIDGTIHPNAFAVIRALQPHWLEVRGGGSVSSGMVKRVYIDELFLGGIAQLRQVEARTIERIEYYDGPAATQRWGQDHSAGVIRIRSLVP